MSRHEGVSCDSCLKSNFRGRRYKCLICYDYDLCANCYEEGATSTRHSADHPMQCILTRSDFELYYGGEVLTPDQPQSFTCPYCKRMGLSDSALLEHVSSDHTDTGLEVVCPVCAALPGGDPNLVTDDFAGHLSLEHRSGGSRDLISFLDEPSAIRHGGVRRMPHSGRALGGPRSRRSNMHFSSSGGGLSTLSPSGRESVDPIAELLQQLSSVRRGGAPQPSQLQQLQMQIQLERQQVTNSPMNHGVRIRRSRFESSVPPPPPLPTSSSIAAIALSRSRRSDDEIRALQQAARQQLERLPRRQQQPVVSSATNATGGSNAAGNASTSSQQSSSSIITLNATGSRDAPIASSSSLPMVSSGIGTCNILGGVSAAAAAAAAQQQSQFLMARFMVSSLDDAELAQLERDRADRSQFVQALMLSTIANIQSFNKPADEDVTDELNSLSLGIGSNNNSTVNKNVKKSTGSDADDQDGAANYNNSGKDEGNCDNLKQVESDSSLADELQSLHAPQVLPRGGQGQQHPGKGKSSSKAMAGAGGGGGGGGGCIDRRSRQQQQANAAKARELKQANSSANTPSSMSSKHVPDSR